MNKIRTAATWFANSNVPLVVLLTATIGVCMWQLIFQVRDIGQHHAREVSRATEIDTTLAKEPEWPTRWNDVPRDMPGK